MAFPVTRSAFAGTQGTNATSWTLTYPSSGDIVDGVSSNSIEAGDLILINIGRDGSTGTGAITDYTSIFDQASGTACRGLTFVKVASGSESGTFTYSPGASEQGAWRIAVIKNWYGTLAGVEVSSAASGLSTAPNAPSLSPSWGAKDTFWRVVCAFDDGRRSISAYPSSPDNFSIYQNSDSSGGSGGAGMGSAGLTKNATSVDPGAFTLSASDDWVAWLIAVRPAEPVTHAATGTLSAGTGVLSGSANRTSPSVTHDATGTLTAGTGALAGSAARQRIRDATGALSGGTGSLSGSAERSRVRDASGSLSGGTGTLAGSAERVAGAVTHDATGTLSAGTGSLSGSAARERTRDASGTLSAGTGALSGASARSRIRDATGTLTAGTGALSGSATRTGATVTHDGTGALSSGAGALSGSAARIRIREASGVLAGAGVVLAGSAARSRVRTTSGSLVGVGALVGAASRTPAAVSHAATGVLVGAGAVLVGAGATPVELTGTQITEWAKRYSGIRRSKG